MVYLRKIILTAFAIMAVQVVVHSQSNDTLPLTQQLDEITVTAQKQEEKLQEVPLSVSSS
jgi:outer membrane receptor protein involved in Fe transport